MLRKIDTFKDTHFEPLKVSTMRSPICLYLISIFHIAVLCGCQQESNKTDLRVETYSRHQRFIEQIANGEFDYGGSVDKLIITSLKLDTLEFGFANWAQDSILALSYDKMGGYLLGEKKYQKAKYSYQKALVLYKRKWKNSGHKNILRMYHNIGLSLFRNNDFQKAISYFDSAGRNANLFKPDLLFQNSFRKAQCYSQIGDYSNAF
jgi:tetratricopeptide (TPR) repeat protein